MAWRPLRGTRPPGPSSLPLPGPRLPGAASAGFSAWPGRPVRWPPGPPRRSSKCLALEVVELLPEWLAAARLWDGSVLGADLQGRLVRDLVLVIQNHGIQQPVHWPM